jgi:hypothetical protein
MRAGGIMSFVLQIWELPQGREWPKTIKEATALVSGLHGQYPGQNPKFIEFARRLTARFPCIMSPEADALDEDEAAWTDGPLDGVTDEAVYGIGINTDRLDDVRPFVIETALALGLSVEDEQAGEYFFANGVVLSIEQVWEAQRRAEAAAAPLLPSKEELSERVCADLADVLTRHGFARAPERDGRGPGYVSTAYLRSTGSSWHQLSVSVAEEGEKQRDFSVEWIPCHMPSSVLRNSIKHDGNIPADASDFTLGRIHQHRWIDDAAGLLEPRGRNGHRHYFVRRHADIAPRTQHLAQQIETRFAAMLAAFDDAQAFDRLVNPDPITGSLFHERYDSGAHHIIAAYLADSPRLEALCAEFWDSTQKPTNFMEGMRLHLHRCIAYVRANPRR